MMVPKAFLIVATLILVVVVDKGQCGNRGCKKESTTIHHSGINAICRLPLGVRLGNNDTDEYAPFVMNRCTCGHQESDDGNDTDEYNSLFQYQQGQPQHKTANTIYGILAALLACVLFGSMFLPVKKFDTGDGMFFQWLMAVGALLVGIIFNVSIWPQPSFFTFAMTGGIIWGCGNILTVPTLKLVGIGMTQTMVGLSNAIGGWISGRFILRQPLKSDLLNTIGVVIILISAVLLAFVGSDGRKTNQKRRKEKPLKESSSVINESERGNTDETTPLVHNEDGNNEDGNNEEDKSWVDRLGKWPSRVIGLSMAICSGLLFGFQFLPAEFIRNCDNAAFPCDELDYVFTQYVGIFFCSTFWFIVYCCFKKFRPQVYSKLIIPGIITGIMWGIGTAMWFLSNKWVGLPVAYPVITSGSGIVGSAWGILVFREIKGKFNIIMFLISVVVVATGIILVGLSH